MAPEKSLKVLLKNSCLLDIGCGGGLFLLHLSRYFPHMNLVGHDISSEAIQIAQEELQLWKKNKLAQNVSFELQSNAQLQMSANSVDIILATLVCHHLTNEELVDFLQTTIHNAREAVIINDLHRHSLSHWFYGLISPILFRNRLITHDGLISIRRGFTRREWQVLLQTAGIKHYKITWCFPFRWRITLWKK